MGNSKWLVVAGLALVAAVAPGCKTKCEEVAPSQPPNGEIRSTTKALMTAFPGVVEIYRYGAIAPEGYVCLDTTSPGWSWWLLYNDATPPVMPTSTSWTDDVIWHVISTENLTGEQLCARYADQHAGARLYHVHGDEILCWWKK